jgi:hypothetical protein
MPKRTLPLFCLGFFLCPAVFLFPQNGSGQFPVSSPRSVDEIFPSLDAETRDQAFSSGGYFICHEENYRPLETSGLDPRLTAVINSLNPSVVIESIVIVPYPGGPMEPVDIYNGLRNIRALKGRLYHSETRNADIPLFEDATRLESSKRTGIREDPPPQGSLPDSETIYIRLKDANFGNSYYQADIKKNAAGFTYSLSNNRDLSYTIIPVIKAGHLIAQFYFEPVREGILVYGISGAKVSGFITAMTDMPSAIQKRLEVILSWAIDGVSGRL